VTDFVFYSFDVIWLGIPYEYKEEDQVKGEHYSLGEFRATKQKESIIVHVNLELNKKCSVIRAKLNSGKESFFDCKSFYYHQNSRDWILCTMFPY